MNHYDLTPFSITDCDTALQKISRKIAKLKKKRERLEHRLEVHQEVVRNATEELHSRQLDLSFQNDRLSRVAEGIPTLECQYLISRAQCRIRFLELRLGKYSMSSGAMKTLELNELAMALEQALQFKTALETRRAELLQAQAPIKPALPAEPEPAAMIPLIPAQRPAADLQPAAGAQPVAPLFQKQKGKRWVKAKQAMKRAG